MDFFISSAYAQSAGAGQGGGAGTLILLILFPLIFYFLLIRPQNKRQKEHREMIAALNKGDEVVSGGGVLGKIVEVGDAFVTLEISQGVNIKVQRHAIGAVMPKGTIKSA